MRSGGPSARARCVHARGAAGAPQQLVQAARGEGDVRVDDEEEFLVDLPAPAPRAQLGRGGVDGRAVADVAACCHELHALALGGRALACGIVKPDPVTPLDQAIEMSSKLSSQAGLPEARNLVAALPRAA